MRENTETDAQLNGIDAGIRRGDAGVGYVHEADFGADVVLAAEEMQTERGAGGEIDMRGSGGRLDICEQGAAANFEVRDDVLVTGEHPFEGEWINSRTVSVTASLENHEDRDYVDGIFEATFEEAGAMRGGEDDAKTPAHIPDAVVGLAAVYAVAGAGPDLPLVAAFDGARLGLRRWNKCTSTQKEWKNGCRRKTSHRKDPHAELDSQLQFPGAEKIQKIGSKRDKLLGVCRKMLYWKNF